MTSTETPLEMVRRHIRAGESLILRQHDRLRYFEAVESSFADEAQAILDMFNAMQNGHQNRLAQMEEEMRSGRRDADGKLLRLPRAPV